MDKPPAFLCYADDFLAGTMDMTAEEVGVYFRLLCHQWNRGGLLNDPRKLALMAGQCSPESLATGLAKFGYSEDGMLRNARLERERSKQVTYRAKQAENGKKRWVGNAKPPGLALPTHELPIPVPIPSSTPLPPKGGDGRKTENRLPTTEPAKRISKLFHRRESTPWSEKEVRAFKKLMPIDLDDLTIAEAYTEAERMKGDDGVYRRDIYTFLNNFQTEVDRARFWKELPAPANGHRVNDKVNSLHGITILK
jgi:hypothetical protein